MTVKLAAHVGMGFTVIAALGPRAVQAVHAGLRVVLISSPMNRVRSDLRQLCEEVLLEVQAGHPEAVVFWRSRPMAVPAGAFAAVCTGERSVDSSMPVNGVIESRDLGEI